MNGRLSPGGQGQGQGQAGLQGPAFNWKLIFWLSILFFLIGPWIGGPEGQNYHTAQERCLLLDGHSGRISSFDGLDRVAKDLLEKEEITGKEVLELAGVKNKEASMDKSSSESAWHDLISFPYR